jgi:Autophagy protein Apg9.
LFGETIFFTSGLKYNLELLLFWGPWAPFRNNWHLREDYKKISKRKELAQLLSKHILWVGMANFALCPLILLWQILYLFFSYADLIKREPAAMSLRSWSLYGRLYVRHFNELDHELNARLNRAYKNASKYMSMFTSPLTSILATNVCFVGGGIFMVLVMLSVYDEDVLAVEHLLTILSFCGLLATVSRSMLPDENMVWCPEQLMTAIIAQIHYCPEHWKGQAHTTQVRKEFSQLFHYKIIHLLEELVSPIITPLILCFYLRTKSLDIVDFFRNFTVEVAGVGDVCSFSLMDLHRHGSPDWQESVRSQIPTTEPSLHAQAEIGKTELSLVHFMYTNPRWIPPADAQNFFMAFRNRAMQDRDQLGILNNEINPLYSSLNSMSSLGVGYNNLVQSIVCGRGRGLTGSSIAGVPQFQPPFASATASGPGAGHMEPVHFHSVKVRTSRVEGPPIPEHGLLYSLQQPGASLGASVFGEGREIHEDTVEMTTVDMNLSTLYLHNLHQYNMRQRGYQDPRGMWHRPGHDSGTSSHQAETTPLLDSAARPPRNT